MKPTFEKTVDVLVKAYLNDTLEHTTCWACAVGNLVAHHCGYKMLREDKYTEWHWLDDQNKPVKPDWFDVTSCGEVDKDYYNGLAKSQLDATGYKPKQLARIEYAFENAPMGKNDDDYMFNGLMAVVDVLADIHGIDLKTKESAKLLFVKPLTL